MDSEQRLGGACRILHRQSQALPAKTANGRIVCGARAELRAGMHAGKPGGERAGSVKLSR